MAEDYGQSYTFSSGITAIILPFPALRHEKISALALKNFPDPKPPKKKIKVVDGEEIIDDINNAAFVENKTANERKRDRWLSEKILNIALRDCIELDIEPYEQIIKLLEEDNEQSYPVDTPSRKLEFIKDYVVRSGRDFTDLVKLTTRLMTISTEEVSTQVDDIFPGEMAQSTGNGAQTSGLIEKEPLGV